MSGTIEDIEKGQRERALRSQEINKYLTEAMGECWHEWGEVGCKCLKCKSIQYVNTNDFYTNEGYGKLRDWYDGWDENKRERFLDYLIDIIDDELSDYCIIRYLQVFHRDRFATLICEFLEEGE